MGPSHQSLRILHHGRYQVLVSAALALRYVHQILSVLASVIYCAVFCNARSSDSEYL